MKTLFKTLSVILPIATFSVPAFPQEARWKELNERAVTLYQQGMYSEAAQVAEEVLKVAENTFGPIHPYVATSLNNLALLYYFQGNYAEAEPLYKLSLAIWEKSLGLDHPNVASCLRNMAECFKKTGKKNEAKRLEERASIIEAKNLLR
jgi:tetratricopeptide (TPR) repeat protein